MLSRKPIKITGITFIPNSAGDGCILSYHDLASVVVAKKSAVVTVSSNNTLTSVPTGGNVFPNTYAAGDAVLLEAPVDVDGVKANAGLHLIGTVGNNDRFIVADSVLTDYTAKLTTVTSFTKRMAAQILSQATTKLGVHVPFCCGGVHLPNLSLTTLSTSGIVLVYFE